MAFIGSGPNVTNLNASNLDSGTVPTARLGSGTADSTTYLRGDQTWATVSGGVTSLNGQTGAITNTDLGAIGSYIVAYYARTNPNTGARFSYVAVNTTLAGSSLRYYNISTQSDIATNYPATSFGASVSSTNSAFPTTNTTALTGTWRKVAAARDGQSDGSNYYWFSSLWVRIS